MSLLWADGFDTYTQFNQKWAPTNFAATFAGPGAFGFGKYLYSTASSSDGFAYRPFAVSQTIISFGVRVYSALPFPSMGIAGASDGSRLLYKLYVDSNGALRFNNGTSDVLISASGVIPTAAWSYVECVVALATTSTGTIMLKVNGDQIATATSVPTALASSASGVALYYRGGSGSSRYDDFYAASGDVYGPHSIFTQQPVGAGRATQFNLHGAPTNWQAESTTPPQSLIYVYSDDSGNEDAYRMTALPDWAQSVAACQVSALAYCSDADGQLLELGFGNGLTENFDSGTLQPASAHYTARPLSVNPLTSLPFTVADFALDQGAIKVPPAPSHPPHVYDYQAGIQVAVLIPDAAPITPHVYDYQAGIQVMVPIP